jgi:carboxylesterase type B
MRLSVIAASLGVASAQSEWKIGQGVKTTSGTIVGQASSWKKEVSEYLGVPFAQPPIAALRWQAPMPLDQPSVVINATRYVCCSAAKP